MSIFTNEKKGCPICGNATPRLFPTKVEGLPLCKECTAKISMESSILKDLTINELWDHLDYRKANGETFESFVAGETHSLGKSFKLRMDGNKELFFIDGDYPSNPPLFKYSELAGFSLIEDGRTAVQCGQNGYNESESSITTYVIPKKPLVKPGVGGAKIPASNTTGSSTAEEKPKAPDRPISSLKLELVLTNPYWKAKSYSISLRTVSDEDDLRDWVNDYKNTFASAIDTCEALARVMGVKTGKVQAAEIKDKADAIAAVQNAEAAASAAKAAASDAEAAEKAAKAASDAAAIEMLKKWKELLDLGALTQEEFDAKKKELLGL